jgi:ubiquitin-protein ligase
MKTSRLTKENTILQKRITENNGPEKHLEKERWVVSMSDDICIWHGALLGPMETPYEGQQYAVKLDFTNVKYPESPPKVTFTAAIPFHANVYNNGNICIDILRGTGEGGTWTPVYKIEHILASLVSMLDEPNTQSPANGEAATAYDSDKSEKKQKFAKLVLEKYVAQIK